MRFRKLVLCMVVGILLCAFPNISTYATEEVTVNTEQVEATETEAIDSTEAAKVIEAASAVAAPVTEEVAPKAEEAAKEEGQTEEIKTEENNKETSNIDKKSEVKEVKKAKAEDSDKKAETKTKEKKAEKKEEEKQKKYSEADLRLLSAIIYCEAGSESYKGKVAVGIVIMNRVKSGSFPDTVKGVIYQSYQFSPVRNGSLDRALDKYDKGRFTSEDEKECIQAAKEVLSGKTTITLDGKEKDLSKYLFFSGRLKGHTLKIGNHQFK